MFDDRHATRGGKDSGSGRQVEASRTVSAGTDDIGCPTAGRQRHFDSEPAHDFCESAHLGSGLALGAQCGEQCPGLCVADFAAGNGLQHRLGLGLFEIPTLE